MVQDLIWYMEIEQHMMANGNGYGLEIDLKLQAGPHIGKLKQYINQEMVAAILVIKTNAMIGDVWTGQLQLVKLEYLAVVQDTNGSMVN